MKAFYLIENGQAQVGQGELVPDGFTVYEVGNEPVELLEALQAEEAKSLQEAKLSEAKSYLTNTDFYYARLSETGELVPDEVVAKRKEAREFIRSNK